MVRSRIELIGSGGGLKSWTRTRMRRRMRTSPSWKVILMPTSGTWLVMGGSDLDWRLKSDILGFLLDIVI